MSELFRRIARKVSDACGTWQAFALNACAVLVWLAAGPLLHWSDTWQLVCNTFTTVVTYLLVFLVMNTQRRDTDQLTLKVDALIAALPRADNGMLDLESMSEDELAALRGRLSALGRRRKKALRDSL